MRKRLIVLVTALIICVAGFAQEREYEPNILGLGDKAPTFITMDQHGKKISLEEELTKGPVVVLFYRGQWCPYCYKHMAALQDSLAMIQEYNATVIAITPEKTSEINKMEEKSGAKFAIIYDRAHAIMDMYKVTFRQEDSKRKKHKLIGIDINEAAGNDDQVLPVPATYIINTDGRIIGRHFDTNYKVRMSVKDILEVLKNNTAK